METKRKLIGDLYNDPSFGFVGVQKLYERAKALDRRITVKDVRDWLASDLNSQRFKEQKPNFQQFKIASSNPNSWQIDLAFWLKKPILTAVNINSRLGYAKLLANKKAETVLKAISDFVKTNKVEIITSDNGSEFLNRSVLKFLKDKAIEHYNNEPGDHGTMGKIERFNRTIKQRLMQIQKPITNQLLSQVINNYNTTTHRSIGMTPLEAKGEVMEKELDHNQNVMSKLDRELGIGSKVIYRLKKNPFGKEGIRWSKAVYEIVGIDGYRVQIRSKNRHILYKSPNDIKIVQAETTEAPFKEGDIFEVEKILGHKKMKNGKNKYHIKWVDYDETSWEPQDNLRLVNKNRLSTIEKKYFKSLREAAK